MKRLAIGIEIPVTDSLRASIYNIFPHSSTPEMRDKMIVLPHTRSASELYKYLFSSNKTEYDVVEFFVSYMNTVYVTCLTIWKPVYHPPTTIIIEDTWKVFARGVSLYDFKYDETRPIAVHNGFGWSVTDIDYVNS